MREFTPQKLRPWFALQLRLVEALQQQHGMTCLEAVTLYTNLHRRMGFGKPGFTTTDGTGCAPAWLEFVGALDGLPHVHQRLDAVVAFAQQRLVSDAPPVSDRQPSVGCFSCALPMAGGSSSRVARLHFFAGGDAQGRPLQAIYHARRCAELGMLFSYLKQHHSSEIDSVAGASWLYNLSSYRRLFPQRYLASARPLQARGLTPTGMPFWGQFLDHRLSVHADRAAHFTGSLADIDLQAWWRIFPLPVWQLQAPAADFFTHFE